MFDQLLDGRVLGVDVRAFVDARQKARLPVLSFLDGIAERAHRDERRAGSGSRCRGRSRARSRGWGGFGGRRRSSSAAAMASWLGMSACIERITAMSSIDSAVRRKMSLTSMPLCPYL